MFGGLARKSGDVRVACTPAQIAEMMHGFAAPVSSGEHVTEESAMRTSAVFACVGILSESVAQLPLKLYRDDGKGGKVVAREHHLHRLISRRPNPWMTAFEWREMGQMWLCLNGNHYAFKVKDGEGKILEILPIPSSAVSVRRLDNWDLVYTVNFGDGRGQREVPAADMIHVRFRAKDGYRGISPIGWARESIGLALATEKHGARLFANNARPGVILETPKQLSPEAAKRFKEDWQAAFTGENAHKTAVLEEGMTAKPLSMTSEDAQFLETRRFQIAEIARFYRVPPHMLGETEKSTSWGTGIESMTAEFVRFTLQPWIERWDQALTRDLLTEDEQDIYTIEHLVDGMERGDIKSRYAAYNIGIMSGILSANECRAKENLPKREGGDIYLTPSNMRIGTDDENDLGSPNPPSNGTTGKKSAPSIAKHCADPLQLTVNVAPPSVEMKAGDVNVSVPERSVHVTAEVKESPPQVIVNVPEQPVPEVKVDAIFKPEVKVDVQPAEVVVHLPARKTETTVNRDKNGNIVNTTQIETDA